MLGSRATFALGKFGGHATGTLRAGEVLHLARTSQTAKPANDPAPLTREWQVGVLYGPHGAPDFFLTEDIETLFSTAYEVHFNSARTGVRLIGPAPKWARTDGGEAGLHPSNLHDNAYAVGAIDFTGDFKNLTRGRMVSNPLEVTACLGRKNRLSSSNKNSISCFIIARGLGERLESAEGVLSVTIDNKIVTTCGIVPCAQNQPKRKHRKHDQLANPYGHQLS